MKKFLPVLALLGVSCAAVSGPPPSAAWGPFSVYYDLREAERTSAYGVRVGGFVPTGGDETFDPTWTAGLAYLREKQRSSIKFMEFGVDYSPTQSEQRDSQLFIVRFDVAIAGAGGGQYGVYGMAGLHAIIEDSVIPEAVDPEHEIYWSIDLNLGAGYRTRTFDLRLNYVVLLASENVPGILVVGAGVYF